MPQPGPARHNSFRRRHRLRHAREYAAVYAGRLKTVQYPLIVYARINDLPEPRLGLAVGRRVGGATTRNAVKRRLREAFRQIRHQIPRSPGGGNYDLVISARPHEVLRTQEYAHRLQRAVDALHRLACRRNERARSDASDD